MTVTEKLGALGSWSVRLSDHTPEEVKASLDYFGHVAIIRGRVNPADHGDTLLRAARYVGVLRRRQGDLESELSGSGMVFWLGDEDDKGQVIEAKLTLTNATLAQAVAAVLPDSVQLGQVLANPAGTYTGTHQWQTPRQALQVICDAFGVEFRVNGDATVDVGTQAQLYATTPDSIVVRRGAGSDLDLSALAGRFDPDASVIDYSTRVVLLGRTEDNGTIATGSAELGTVPHVDLHGNPVRITRLISESDQTEGSVQARAQLQLNRFARTARSLKVTAERYETDGTFLVGDNAYVYDPETGIVSPDYEVTFRGQVLHPDVVRIAGVTWPVSADHTVAFRTQAGEWLDLTRWVVWEDGENELVLGDLPRSLLGDAGNPFLDRTATPTDTVAPQPPTGLTLSSFTATGADGHEAGFILATWTAPTVNEDGSVVTDLSHYLVAWKWSDGGTWQYSTVAATEATLTATPGLPYTVFVGAYDRSNNFSGWSAVQSILVEADSTAPLAPSDPSVGNYLGQLRIEWDGLMADGTAPPADFSRVDVHVDTASGFTPTEANRVAFLSASGVAYATAAYGSTAWVRLVAYDHTGNASTPSGSVSGSTSKVVGDDILDGAVGTAKLADLAVVTAKIGDLAVNDAKIANLNVGKLVSGEMTADVVIGGKFTTALAGQRVEVTSDAIRAWSDDTTMTVELDGVSNLLTGTLQTALAGRRLVAGAAGAAGEISFFAPDNTRSFIRAHTEGGTDAPEAIQFGVEVPGFMETLWNRINYNRSSLGEYATYRSGTHEFIFDGSDNMKRRETDGSLTPGVGRFVVFETATRAAADTPWPRFMVNTDGTFVYHPDGTLGFRVLPTGLAYWDDGNVQRFSVDQLTGGPQGRLIYWDATAKARLMIAADQTSLWDGVHSSARLFISANDTVLRDEAGIDRMTIYGASTGSSQTLFRFPGNNARITMLSPGAGRTDTSGVLSFANHYNYYTELRYLSTSDGTSYRLEIGAAGIYTPVWCGTVTELSSRKAKTGIAPFTDDALATVRGIAVRRFRYRGASSKDGNFGPDGPEEIVTRDQDGVIVGVRPSAQIALLTRAVQQLADRVDALTTRKDAAA